MNLGWKYENKEPMSLARSSTISIYNSSPLMSAAHHKGASGPVTRLITINLSADLVKEIGSSNTNLSVSGVVFLGQLQPEIDATSHCLAPRTGEARRYITVFHKMIF